MKKFIGLFSFIILSGCSHNLVINPNIQPNSFVNKKIDSSVGVLLSNDLKNHENRVNPSSFSGSAHSYIFYIGKSLSGALMRSVQIAYQDAIEIDTMDNSNIDKIFKFSLKQSNIDINFQDGFFVPNARANCSISVGMEAYNGKTNELLKMTTINGSGFSSQAADAFNADKTFSKAAEDAIQQICDNVANLLISGFAESKEINKSETDTTSELVDVILLKSGSVLEGSIINKNDSFFEIRLVNGSVVKIEKERIDKIETKVK